MQMGKVELKVKESDYQQFEKEVFDLTVTRMKVTSILGVFLFFLFGIVDYVIAPQYFGKFMVMRTINSFIDLGIFFALRKGTFRRYTYFFVYLFFLLLSSFIEVMIKYTGGHESPYYAGMNIVILAFCLLMPMSLKKSLPLYIIVYLSYLLPSLISEKITNFPVFFSNNLFILWTAIISATATYLAHSLRFQAFKSRIQLENTKDNLEKAYTKLKELDHLKSQFFANISHELRTPLTLILAPLESMLKGGQPGTNGERRNVQIMYSNGLRLLKLINNLLDLAKIDAGKMELFYAKGDLRTFLKGVVTSVSPMAEKKQVRMSFKDLGGFPEIYFDRDKIEKVMLNLLFNSLKFTDTGGKVEVSLSLENGHVLVKVSDTGIGIAKENHTKIFERFSQVDSSDSRKYEGTGVGLALVKELVELHQGRIWVESEIGQGTTMAFTLPMITQQDHLPADRRVQAQLVAEKKRADDWTRSIHTEAEYNAAGIIRETSEDDLVENPSANGHRLLLVEDNPDMLNFLIFQLKGEYALITARDGEEGIQKVMAQLPDLVVSDVMMPVKDGYQLCKEIKADSRTRHIPVILLTAKADLSMKIEGLQYGADDYLTKPFSSEELMARIKSLLHLRQLEREIQSRNEELQRALTELKETQAQLVHSEKMAALGLLVAGVAHEINNPVNFAKSSLSNLRKSFGEAKKLLEESQSSQAVLEKSQVMESAIEIIKAGLERTEIIVNDLKNFVRKDQPHFRPTDLHQGLDSTLTLLGHELGNTIRIEKMYGGLDPVDTIPGQINQVFMNLLHNAIEAIRMKGAGEGVIQIKTWKMDDEAFISIWDNGKGIKKEDQPHVFEPFFTTKDVGKGTGLGLAVTYRIIENHKGRIEVQSEPGKWTTFTIVLPFRQEQKT
jgi:signal transduction histidine kinase